MLKLKLRTTEREKAQKKFQEMNLGDRVRTNKDYSHNCSYPLEGMVVGKRTLSGLEKDTDAIPYLIAILTKSGIVVEVNTLWLEKVG